MGDVALSVGMPSRPAHKGWEWVALTDVARLESGHTPSRNHPEYWGGDIPWIGIKDAKRFNGREIPETIENTNELGIENSSSRVLPKGTVCLSRTASVGYVVKMGSEMATSQDFANWVCGDRLDPDFLKYLFIAENAALDRFSSGSVHQTIYYPELKAFTVCIPPLEEQQRIVAILDEAFEGLDRAHAYAEANLQNVRELFENSLIAIFDGVEARAERMTLAMASSAFGRGRSRHRPRNAPFLYGGPYPFIQTGDVRNSDSTVSEFSQTYSEAGLAQSKLWPAGTVCITIAANIAETAVLGFDACFPDSIIGMVADPNVTFPEYVEFMLRYFAAELKGLGKGSAQDNINLATFETATFPFPSIEEQRFVVDRLSQLSSETAALEESYRGKLESLKDLRQSLLQKAFAGELT
jgi:type I restriction enzyme, S subunit